MMYFEIKYWNATYWVYIYREEIPFMVDRWRNFGFVDVVEKKKKAAHKLCCKLCCAAIRHLWTRTSSTENDNRLLLENSFRLRTRACKYLH